MKAAPSGYSGTPLAKKLGLAPPMTLAAIDAPTEYRTWLGTLPKGVDVVARAANSIREIALPLGLVDIKVCAVSDVWSGLKLVIRKSERAG